MPRPRLVRVRDVDDPAGIEDPAVAVALPVIVEIGQSWTEPGGDLVAALGVCAPDGKAEPPS